MAALLAGPLSSIYSHKRVSVAAGALIAFGLFMSHMITAAWQLFFTYSLCVGFGSGLIYSSSFLLVNLYFDQKRGLALGVFNASATLGRILFPTAEHWMLETFTDSGTVLLMSSVALHLIPAAMLFDPVERHLPTNNRNESNVPAAPIADFAPTDAEEITGLMRSSESCEPEIDIASPSPVDRHQHCPNRGLASLMVGPMSVSTSSHIHHAAKKDQRNLREVDLDLFKNMRRASESHVHLISSRSPRLAVRCPDSTRDICGSSVAFLQYRGYSRLSMRLRGSSSAYHDDDENPSPGMKADDDANLAKRIFAQLDFGLLRNPMLLILLFSDCLYWLTYFNFVLMLPMSAREKGLSRRQTATLLSLPPMSDIVVRLVVPVMVDRGWVDERVVYLVGLATVLVAVLLFPLVSGVATYACCLLFGVGCGSAVTHFGLVLVHYFGVHNLPSTKGFTMFSNGFCYITVGPLLGLLRTNTGNFRASYFTLAACMSVSLLLWALEPWAKQFTTPTPTHQGDRTNIAEIHEGHQEVVKCNSGEGEGEEDDDEEFEEIDGEIDPESQCAQNRNRKQQQQHNIRVEDSLPAEVTTAHRDPTTGHRKQ
ncbi:unnamed protein product [Notodromas monacha]|uniref:Monocarboxylate transporter n=1 Tax=Notodromas monacha TaxID=399045 RepID=A0A7R9BXQ3_9CRUS|nr:unnamed protein product [Notodromas monacha]CAG0922336.1 unnamed protein product [Notodromas monacha]